jgi:hypothetical protein
MAVLNRTWELCLASVYALAFTGVAGAADLGVKAPIVPPVPVFIQRHGYVAAIEQLQLKARGIEPEPTQPRPRQCAVAPDGADRLHKYAMPIQLPHVERGVPVLFDSAVWRSDGAMAFRAEHHRRALRE